MTTIDIVKSDEQILYTKEDVIKLLEQQKKEFVERHTPKVKKCIYTMFDEIQEHLNEGHHVTIEVDKFVEAVNKCLL